MTFNFLFYKLSIIKGCYKGFEKYIWCLCLVHGKYVMNMNYYSIIIVISRAEDHAEDARLNWQV